jgi:DNA-binding transcriptional MerR regulator
VQELLLAQASEVVGVHPNTLKRYEQKGLIRSKRDYNNWRRFRVEELLELKKKLNSSPKKQAG